MSEAITRGKRPLDSDEGTGKEEKTEEGREEKRDGSPPVARPPPRTQQPSRSWNPFTFMKRSFTSEGRSKEYWQNLSLEEKRKKYKCGKDYVTIDSIVTWPEFYSQSKCKPFIGSPNYPVNTSLNKIISLYQGDITKLEIDGIVNAANSSLLGGGGVDGAIHSAAGYSLEDECAELGGCDTGMTKITTGHRLPAKHVLHTVGPFNGSAKLLTSCYNTCFDLIKEHGLRTVAFCCIATGVYGFPNEEAANIALNTTRKWLETDDNYSRVDRIIFVVFLKMDYKLYGELLQKYFPLGDDEVTTPPPDGTSTPPHNDEEKLDKEDGVPFKPSLLKSATAPPLHTQPAPPSIKSEKMEEENIEEKVEEKVEEMEKEESGGVNSNSSSAGPVSISDEVHKEEVHKEERGEECVNSENDDVMKKGGNEIEEEKLITDKEEDEKPPPNKDDEPSNDNNIDSNNVV